LFGWAFRESDVSLQLDRRHQLGSGLLRRLQTIGCQNVLGVQHASALRTSWLRTIHCSLRLASVVLDHAQTASNASFRVFHLELIRYVLLDVSDALASLP
jgi:hypothetical protein